MVPPYIVCLARSGSTWMYWWSPVRSAKAFTCSWVICVQAPAPSSCPTRRLSSSTVCTSAGISLTLSLPSSGGSAPRPLLRETILSGDGRLPRPDPASRLEPPPRVLPRPGWRRLPRALAGEGQGQGPLAVEIGVAVQGLEVLGALEVEVQVELPGEADAPVHLNGVATDLARRPADVRLGHRGGEGGVRRPGTQRPGGVVRGGVRLLHLEQHLGAGVLDRLEAADRLAELLPRSGVLDTHLQGLARRPQHLRAGSHGGLPEDVFEDRRGPADRADDLVASDRHVAQDDLPDAGGQVGRRH